MKKKNAQKTKAQTNRCVADRRLSSSSNLSLPYNQSRYVQFYCCRLTWNFTFVFILAFSFIASSMQVNNKKIIITNNNNNNKYSVHITSQTLPHRKVAYIRSRLVYIVHYLLPYDHKCVLIYIIHIPCIPAP